ncbi:MAG TPA: hypothetical protein PKW35_20890 [Nannocystaceae bacterium]|nr:hypothetical protein [Nannocystaceae bacterium]
MHDPIGDDPRGGIRVRGLGPATAPTAASATDPTAAAERADASGATEATHPLTATEATSGAAELRDAASIGEALGAGAIDADTARAQLIDTIVASQLPRGASPALFAAIRDQVAAMLTDNPHLADLLRRA